MYNASHSGAKLPKQYERIARVKKPQKHQKSDIKRLVTKPTEQPPSTVHKTE
jgi:hypothetical protein